MPSFFVLNASAPKLMRLGVDEETCDGWLTSNRKQLKLRHKASAEAEFHFKDIVIDLISNRSEERRVGKECRL